MAVMAYEIEQALARVFESPNEVDSNLENANVVDGLYAVGRALRANARAIYPSDTSPGEDANGGHVESLTEAVMGISASLGRVADGLDAIAAAIREK